MDAMYEGDTALQYQRMRTSENHVFPCIFISASTALRRDRRVRLPGSDIRIIRAILVHDYCTVYLWSLQPDGMGGFIETEFGQKVTFISSFGENSAGELFACSMLDGTLYR